MEFVKFNANPKGKKTGDCVVRAICTALNETWADTYKGMLDVALDTGEAISCKGNFSEYLKRKGYIMQKMPKKFNNKRYTVEEFADQLAKPGMTYVLNVANHLTMVRNKNLYDLWNCKNKSVGNYWIIN